MNSADTVGQKDSLFLSFYKHKNLVLAGFFVFFVAGFFAISALQVSTAQAAIQYVGGQTAGFAGKTSATTVTFALTGGTNSVPAAGDLVIVSYVVGGTADKALTINNMSAVAYTLIGTELYYNDTYDVNQRVAYRFMPATPETQFSLSQTFSTADAGRYTVHVFRNVDSATPLDVAAVSAGAIDSSTVNPAAITPTTSGAFIYITGGAASAAGSTMTAAYLSGFTAGSTADTVDASIGSGYLAWTSGAYDGAAFGNPPAGTTANSWSSMTVALRPSTTSGSCSSAGTGAWATGGTWGAGCTGAGGVPSGMDDVTILNTHNVTIATGVWGTANNITVNSGGTLTVTSTGTLTNYGNFTNSSGGTVAGTGALILAGNATTIDGSGTTSLSGLTTIRNNKTVQASAVLSFAGALTIATGTVTNNGSISVTGVFTKTGNWTQGTNSTLTLVAAPAGAGTLTATASGNTVNYSGGAQTAIAVTYANLTLSGSGAKTLTSITTVNGNLTMAGTATTTGNVITTIGGNLALNGSANTFTTGANLTVTGTATIGNGSSFVSGAFTTRIDGTLTVGAGTTGIFTATNSTGLTFKGDVILNVGATFTKPSSGAVTVTFSKGAAQTITDSTASKQDLGLVVTATASTSVSTSTNIKVTSLNIAGSTTFDITSDTLFITATATPLVVTGTFTTTSSTVTYQGNAATGILATTYHHLTLAPSSTGAQEIGAGTFTINGNFTIGNGTNAGATALANDPTINVTGNFVISNNATFEASDVGVLTIGGNYTEGATASTFTHSSGTIAFNGGGTSTFSVGAAVTTFYNFTVTTAGKQLRFTSGETYAVAGLLTLTGGSGNEIDINSTTGSTVWNFTFTGTSAVTFTTVRYSNCTQASPTISGATDGSPGGTNTGSCWAFPGAGISIGGSANGNNAATVRVAVNGSLAAQTTTISASAWTIAGVAVTSGQVVTVWVDGVTDANESTAVAKYDGTGNMTGMVLNTNILTIGSSDNQSISIANLDLYDCTADGDIMYQAGSSALAVQGASCAADPTDANAVSNTYSDETVSILASNTFTVDNTESVSTDNMSLAGTITSTGNAAYTVSGSWTDTGTFTPATSTVTFTSTTTGQTITTTGSSFSTLTFNGVGGGWTLQDSTTVSSVLTITNGNFNGGTGTTIILSGSGTPFVNNGTFTGGTSTVRFTGTTATNIDNANYYHLEVKPGGNGITHTLLGGTFNIGGNVVFGNGTNTTAAVTGATNNPVLNVGGLLSIANNTTYTTGTGTLTLTSTLATAGPVLSIGSNASTSHFVASAGHTTALTASSGTVTVFVAEYTNGFNNANGNQFYNFVVNGAALFDFEDQSFDVANELTISAGTLTDGDSGGDMEVGSTGISGSGKVHVASGAALYVRNFYSQTNATGSLCVGSTGATCADTTAGTITFRGNWYLNNGATDFRTISIGGSGTTISLGQLVNGGIGKTTFNAGSSTIIFIGAQTGPMTNAEYFDAFNAGTSTIKYTGTTNFNIGGVTYNNLEVSPGENSVTGTFVADADSLDALGTFVTGNLVIGVGSGTSRVVTANTNSTTLDVNGNFTINANTTFVAHASNPFTIGGSFTNSGTFTHSNGTVTLDSTTTAVIAGNASTETSFRNLTIATPNKTVQFTSTHKFGVVSGGVFTVTGSGAGQVTITSTTGNSQWIMNHQGTEAITYATVSWSGCETSPASTEITATGTGNVNGGNNGTCWTFAAAGITVSGFVYQADGTTVDPTVRSLKLSLGGAAAQTTSSIVTTGAFSFSTQSAPTAGDIITIWINGETPKGALVLRYGTSCTGNPNCTGLSLVTGRVTIAQKFTSGFTNALLATCDNNAGTGCTTSDLGFDSDGTNLTVMSGRGLLIANGTDYIPGGTLTTPASASSGANDGDLRIGTSSLLDMGANALSVGGDFINAGTFSETGTQTTTFTATATGHNIDNGTGNLDNVIFNGAGGGWSFVDANNSVSGDITVTAGTLSGTTNLDVNGGDLTGVGTVNLTAGTLTVNGAGNFGSSTAWNVFNVSFTGAATATTASTAGLISVAGDLSVGTNHTLDGTASFTVVGNVDGAGLITKAAGTFTQNNTVAKNFGGAGNWSFYDLTFSGASATSTATGAGSVTVANVLTVASTHTLAAGAKTWTLTSNGTPFVVGGTFTANTSTFSFVPTGTTGTVIPTLTYYNLTTNKASETFTPATGTLTVGGDLTNTAGTIQFNTNDPTVVVNGHVTNDGTLSASATASITLEGDFTNNGTFTANGGTVTYAPVANAKIATINGANGITFYNFTNTTAGSSLVFKSGNTYVFGGTLTLTGATGNPIWITSETLGVQWTATLNLGSLFRVNIRDAACFESNTLAPNRQISNQGNNGSCWGLIQIGPGGILNAPIDGGASGSIGGTSGGGRSGGGGGTGGGGPGGEGSSTATATANLSNGSIISFTITNAGSSYSSPPTVTIQDVGGGIGGAGTAVLGNEGAAGTVVSITVTSAGSGYTASITVTIAAGGAPGGGGGGESP